MSDGVLDQLVAAGANWPVVTSAVGNENVGMFFKRNYRASMPLESVERQNSRTGSACVRTLMSWQYWFLVGVRWATQNL